MCVVHIDLYAKHTTGYLLPTLAMCYPGNTLERAITTYNSSQAAYKIYLDRHKSVVNAGHSRRGGE
jgi:hypothetical protein